MAAIAALVLGIAIAWGWARYFHPIPKRYWVLYVLLSAALFFRPLFFDRWFQIPHYGLYATRLFPFAGVTDARDLHDNDLLSDVVSQFYPWQMTARSELLAGRFPLYNPHAACGTPLLENAQSSVFSLPSLLSLAFPPLDGLTAAALFQILLVLLFMHSYLSQLELSPGACAFGAAAFAFSAYAFAWLYFPHMRVVPYLPLLLFCIEKLRGGPSKKFTLLAAFAMAQMVVAGHPESAFFFLLFAAAYAVRVLLISRRRRALLGSLAVASALALLLSAFFWLPFLDYLPHSLRFNWLETHRLYAPGSFLAGVKELAVFINPLFYGIPTIHFSAAPNNFNEMAGYAGIFALFFSLHSFSSRRDQPVVFYAAAGVVAILMVINAPGIPWLIGHIPLLRFSAYKRMRFFLTLALAVLGAIGLDRLRKEGGPKPLPGAIFLFGISGLMGLSWTMRQPMPGLVWAFCIGTFCFLLYGVALALKVRSHAVLMILVLADLIAPMLGLHPALDAKLEMKPTPAVAFLQANGRDCRFAAEGVQFMPNVGGLYGLEDARFNDPMTPWAYFKFLETTKLIKEDYVCPWIAWGTPAVDFLGVRYGLTAPPHRIPGYRPVYRGPDGAIFENPKAMRRFFVPETVETVASEEEVWARLPGADLTRVALAGRGPTGLGPNQGSVEAIEQVSPQHYRIRVQGSGAFWVASSLPALRPWKATVDGRGLPTRTINGHFLSFEVPAGARRVEVRYVHRVFYAGLALSLSGLLIALGYLLWPGRAGPAVSEIPPGERRAV